MFAQKDFSLTDEEYSLIKEWADNHDCTCRVGNRPSLSCCGGEISIIFTPTTIGIAKSAECICGSKLDLESI